jgi:hypothetical protein
LTDKIAVGDNKGDWLMLIKRARLTELEKFPVKITINLSKYWEDTH